MFLVKHMPLIVYHFWFTLFWPTQYTVCILVLKEMYKQRSVMPHESVIFKKYDVCNNMINNFPLVKRPNYHLESFCLNSLQGNVVKEIKFTKLPLKWRMISQPPKRGLNIKENIYVGRSELEFPTFPLLNELSGVLNLFAVFCCSYISIVCLSHSQVWQAVMLHTGCVSGEALFLTLWAPASPQKNDVLPQASAQTTAPLEAGHSGAGVRDVPVSDAARGGQSEHPGRTLAQGDCGETGRRSWDGHGCGE